MPSLVQGGEQIAVITGASGGIGGAIAAALAARGLSPCLTGRNAQRLQRVAEEVSAVGGRPSVVGADLASDDGIRGLAAAVLPLGRLGVLVHSAGAIRLGDVMASAWDDLDELYRINLRAPYLLTKLLLPALVASQGQVVFVNSSAGLRTGPENGLYAATKHALRSLADSTREHVSPLGVRVLSAYPGRTATQMQERVCAFEGKRYDPANLLQPSDVAEVVAHALMLPRTAEVTDIVVRGPRTSARARRSR